MKKIAIVLFSAAVLSLGACNSAETTEKAAAAPGMINSKCPYSGGTASDKMTSQFEGKTVGFCCAGCKAKFDAADAKVKAEMVAKAK